MALFLGRRGRAVGPLYALVLAVGVVVCQAPAPAADNIVVSVDEAKLMKLPERAATVVIGNPLIADGAVQSGGTMVITGKGYGMTNIIALDRSGAVLMEKAIEVRLPGHVVVVYRGITRETYSCTPECGPRITLGDNPDYFNAVINQTTTRDSQARAVSEKGQGKEEEK